MGKIHDKLKAKSQRQHTIMVDARIVSAIKEKAGLDANDTARRMSVFMQGLDQVRADKTLDTGTRHFAMQRLADEAKKLGLKGRWNLLCNVTQCLRTPATWYNRGSYAFYCPDCARDLNRVNARDAERLLGAGQALCIQITTPEAAAELHTMR